GLNSAINVTPVTDGDVIKTRLQNNYANSQISIYNAGAQTWQGNLTDLYPYAGYKIKLNNPSGSILFYNAGTPLNDPVPFAKSGNPPAADPLDETTWTVPTLQYEFNMFVTAEVEANGSIAEDANDKLAAFVGNDLRGVGKVEFIPALNRFELPMLIGANQATENFSFYFYDASLDRVFEITEQLNFKEEGYGTFPNPYPFKVQLFQVQIDKTDTGCGNNASGAISLQTNGGNAPYTYNWSDDVTGPNRANLAAGMYTVSITDTRNIPLVYNIEIISTNTSIPAPTIASSDLDNRVCQGGSITLSASSTANTATFIWKDENDAIIAEQMQISLSNLQQNRTLTVLAKVNGCFTQSETVNITVNSYINAEFSVDDRTPLVAEQEVIFTPDFLDNNVQYQWNFGDGNSSTDPVARHTYTTSGKFNVVLTTQNGSGCSNTFFRNQFIITDGNSTICDSSVDSDGDGIKDDCDNCPYYPNFAQTDDDGNGKGNECDCNFYATNQNFLTIGGTLESKRYIAAQNIISDGKVVSGYTELFAGNQIMLEAGFTVEAGATFLAEISETDLGNCLPFAEDDIDLRQAETSDVRTLSAANQLSVYPNPFNETATIVYQLVAAGEVEVGLYDLNGSLLQLLQPQQ
ncbi:MAG: PKD domain-containing protein, partial [Saprospiraceae bacterium]